MPQRNCKTYGIAEIFYSIQGEGVRAGMPAVFVRFSGCNMRCEKLIQGFDCDTDFKLKRRMTAHEIFYEVRNLARNVGSVIFTGGEPGLQLDAELVQYFVDSDYFIAVETNGTCELPAGIDWITCSPKPESKIILKKANEVKFVLDHGQYPLGFDLVGRRLIETDNALLSPVFDGLEVDVHSLRWCVKLVLENPAYRLSLQQHKTWGVK